METRLSAVQGDFVVQHVQLDRALVGLLAVHGNETNEFATSSAVAVAEIGG